MDTKDDYSDFILYNGYVMGALALFTAFTFSTICLIMTEVPDPSQIKVQSLLLLLNVLFLLSLYCFADSLVRNAYYVRKLPEVKGSYKVSNYLIFILFYSFGLVGGVIIYLFWGLYLLTGISAILYAIMAIAGHKFIMKPIRKHRGY